MYCKKCHSDGNYYHDIDYATNVVPLVAINAILAKYVDTRLCICEENTNVRSSEDASCSNGSVANATATTAAAALTMRGQTSKFNIIDMNRDQTTEVYLGKTTHVQFENNFKTRLQNASPHTLLFKQIHSSTPVLASRILVEHFAVQETCCVYMQPTINKSSSFHIKLNKE